MSCQTLKFQFLQPKWQLSIWTTWDKRNRVQIWCRPSLSNAKIQTQANTLKTKTCRLQSTTGTQNKNQQKSYVFIQWLIKPLLQTRASHSIARSYRTNFDFCFLATLLLSFKVITVFRRHGEKDLSSYLQRHKRCSLGCVQHGWAVTLHNQVTSN